MPNDECATSNQNAGKVMMQAEPGTVIPNSTLREALRQAERAADDIWQRISEAERQRDTHVRQAGAAQDAIDRLRNEHSARTHHVRSLSAAATN